MELGELLSTASAIVAIGSVSGAVLQRSIMANLREQVSDQKTRIEFLEHERAEDKATILRQAADIAALQRVVTGEVHWTAISDLLDHHHKSAVENWREAHELLSEIRDYLRRVP